MKRLVGILFICLCVLAVAKEIPREWKTGTLTSVSFEKKGRPVGVITGSANGSTAALNGISTVRRDDATYYHIDAGDFEYVAKRTLTNRRDKQLNVTVNASIKYATSGEDFYILDDNGEEHRLSLEEKIAKQKKPTAPSAADSAATLDGSAKLRPAVATTSAANSQPPASTGARLSITSLPEGADIEIDGAFMGNAPSLLQLQPGDHKVVISKSGYKPWERTLKVIGGEVNIRAELEKN